MKKQVPIWPVIGVAILILAGVAYMVVIRPKRAEAGRLDEQIAEMQMKVTAAQLASRPQQQATAIKVADVFEVSKAMPDTDDMPGIILDLNSVAEATGIKFVSIQPSAATPKTGYSAIGITLSFEGNYFDLTDFLFRRRQRPCPRRHSGPIWQQPIQQNGNGPYQQIENDEAGEGGPDCHQLPDCEPEEHMSD